MHQIRIQHRRAGKSITELAYRLFGPILTPHRLYLAGIWYRNDPAARTVRYFYSGQRSHATAPKPIPRCCVCGTVRGLYRDEWYKYRCRSVDCVPF